MVGSDITAMMRVLSAHVTTMTEESKSCREAGKERLPFGQIFGVGPSGALNDSIRVVVSQK